VRSYRLPPHPSQTIDRSQRITFDFEGRTVEAYPGDTVASALYASGVRIFSRSFKYHRPRGLLCISGHCSNCLMTVDRVPNVRACTQLVREGMRVRHQNAWPSLRFDALAILDKLDLLLPVGFYYKSFIRPKFLWRLAEPLLRKTAGIGSVDTGYVADDDYEHLYHYTDVAVVGGGPAGCMAALEAANAGARVTLIDDQPSLGGHLRAEALGPSRGGIYRGLPGYQIAGKLAQEVAAKSNVRVLSGASAIGMYEGNFLAALQGKTMIKLRAKRVIVAAGAQETPLVFPNNDLPGVLLGTAVRRLVNLYGVSPGGRGLVVTSNDQGLELALELRDAGIDVATVVDSRVGDHNGSELAEALAQRGVTILSPYTVRLAEGRRRVRGAVVGRFEGGRFEGEERRVPCDFICVAAGYQPSAALLTQGDARVKYDALLGEAAPSQMPPYIYAAGEVTGIHDLDINLLQGRAAGLEAAASLKNGDAPLLEEVAILHKELEDAEKRYRQSIRVNPFTTVPAPARKKFVCTCEDVTEKDILDGISEGFEDVQTLKRYSTVTMGPCQGKMCLKAYLGICAEATGKDLDEIGSTTLRPPLEPVPMGALAGPAHMPMRVAPMHHKHLEMGARMAEVGEWKRPHSYRDVQEEVRAVRERVGIIEVSTLGKLDVRGKDAGKLLDRVYTHIFSNLPVGRIRYGMICSDSGIILDDGTVTRLAEDRFYVTTGTGNVDLVEEWFKWWVAGTGICVHVTNLTPGVAAVNVAGPRARETLSKLTDINLSPEKFKYMTSAQGQVAGVPCLLLRIGFVGETGWEVHFPAEYGEHMWDALLDAGKEFGIMPFGVEAQRVLRLEKKHLIPGQDTDVASNPLEADQAWAVRFEKKDFIGKMALAAANERGLRNKLVGFVMQDSAVPRDGDPVVLNGRPVGRVTSARMSPTIQKGFGMAWVPIELAEEGSEIAIQIDGRNTLAKVALQPIYDPEGIRLRE
jgi:sarcosine oxidase subunit alpha